MNIDRVKYLVKFIRRQGRAAIVHAVSETAEQHFSVTCHICKYWRRTSRERKTCADLVTTGDLFEEVERQMELKRNWDNDQSIFHDFTYAKVNKNFNVIYEVLEDCCSPVCGCTNNPISYLIIKNLIPNDEAGDPEAEYFTLDQNHPKDYN